MEKLAFGNNLICSMQMSCLLHFNILKTARESNITDKMKFITQLKDNVSARFDDFLISRDIITFVCAPFVISPSGEFSINAIKVMLLDEAAVQSELAGIQAAGIMRVAFPVTETEHFLGIELRAMYVLTMFGSTHTHVAAF